MRRSRLLKAASILIMLSSLLRVFFGFTMFNFFTTASTFGSVGKSELKLAGLALGAVALGAAAELVCGFVGAMNWEEPLRAKRCAVWGGVTLALGLLGNGVQALTGYGVSCVAWLTGAVVPALFLTAAFRFYRRSRKR